MIFSPNATLLYTFRCGNSAYFWNTVLTGLRCGGVSVMSSPLKNILPEVGFSNPAIILSVVVLPQPEGPRNVTNSPRFIDSETLFTAYLSS